MRGGRLGAGHSSTQLYSTNSQRKARYSVRLGPHIRERVSIESTKSASLLGYGHSLM